MKHLLSILAITFLSVNVASAALSTEAGEGYPSGFNPIGMTPQGNASVVKAPIRTGPDFMESRLYTDDFVSTDKLMPAELQFVDS